MDRFQLEVNGVFYFLSSCILYSNGREIFLFVGFLGTLGDENDDALRETHIREFKYDFRRTFAQVVYKYIWFDGCFG